MPIWVWAFAAGGAAAAYAISSILGNFFKGSAALLRILSILVFTVSVFFAGGSGVATLWQERIKIKQQEVDAAQEKAKTANTKIKYVFVQKVKVIHDRQIVVHHDIKRDAAAIDAECKLNPKAIKDLNEATE